MAIASENGNAIARVYVAAFMRAPDRGGYQYWLDQANANGLSATLNTIFSLSVVQEIYPASMTNSAFVTSIYNNVFSRDPDAEGLAYWAGFLDSGAKNRGELVLDMINAGLGTPVGTSGRDVIVNRVDYAVGTVELQLDNSVDLLDSISVDGMKSLMAGISGEAATGTSALESTRLSLRSYQDAGGTISASAPSADVAAVLESGRTYVIQAAKGPNSQLDPEITAVLGPDGQAVSGWSNSNYFGEAAQLTVTPTTTGTYTVRIAGEGSTTGAYTLAVSDITDTTSANEHHEVVVDATSQQVIRAPFAQHEFSVSLTEGQTVAVTVSSVTGDTNPLFRPKIFEVRDGEGRTLTSAVPTVSADFGNTTVSVTATSAGVYKVIVGDSYNDLGAFQFAVSATRTGGSSSAQVRTDDYSASTATTASLTAGNSLTGSIESAGDRDWIALSLTAGHAYRIDLQGRDSSNGTLTDPYINSLYDSQGQAISGTTDDDSGTGYDSRLTYTPAASGTYYLEARSWSASGTGTYTVRLTDQSEIPASTETTASLTAGNSLMSVIDTAGDRDWIALSLTAGHEYQIDLQGRDSSNGTLADPLIHSLYDSQGQAITGTRDDDSGTGYDSRLTYTAASTGTYYLEARSYNSTATGTYTVRLTDNTTATGSGSDLPASTATTGSVAVNGTYASEIETAGDRDWIAMSLTASTSYRIELRGSGSSSGTLRDPVIYSLYDSSGQQISNTYNDDGAGSLESRLDFIPGSSGTYYLEARGYGSGTGTYTVSLAGSGDDAPATTATTLSVSAGGTVNGNLEQAGDVDWIRASLTAGYQYYFRVTSLSGATSARPSIGGPYDASGYYASGVTYENADALYFTPTVSGNYYVAAYGFQYPNTGAYQMALTQIVDDAPASTATTLTVSTGGSVTGNIERAGDVDWIAASLTAGTQYQIDVEGTSTSAGTLASPDLYGIYDAAGNPVYSGVTASTGTGDNDRAYFTPGTTGTYYFAAYSSDGSGTYTVRLSQSGDDAPATSATTLSVSPGGTRTGTIETAYDRDWIAVDLTAGTRYQFDVKGADSGSGTLSDPYLGGLYDANGAYQSGTYDDDSGVGLDARLTYTPAATGRYYLEAKGYGNSTGTYTVAVTGETTTTSTTTTTSDLAASTATTGVVTVGGTLSSRIDSAGDVDWVRVSLTAGQLYEVSMQGAPTQQGTLTDPYITGIYSSAGSLYVGTTDDDSGAGLNALASFVAPTTGDYYVGLRGYGSTTGTYTVSVSSQGSLSSSTVTPPTGTGTWTIMVYVNGDNDLERYALIDLNEMEAANLPTGVNVAVAVDRTPGYDSSNGNWTDTRYGLVGRDYNTSLVSSSLTSQGELNMGAQSTLTNFINWAAQTAPASNYALVLWDHGGGLSGVSFDQTSNNESLSFNEVKNAIAGSSIQSVSMIGYDACLMGMAEQAHALTGVASYLVASEETEPGDGWNYTTWLTNAFSGGASADVSALAQAVVTSYGAHYQQQSDVTLSAVAIDRMPSVVSALQGFVQATQSASSTDWTAIQSAYQAATRFNYASTVDLRGFANNLAASATISSSLDSAAAALASAVNNSVVSATSNMSGANGMAIYWPDHQSSSFSSVYNSTEVSLVGSVAWNTFLQNYWEHT